ncbi:MAG TPA: S41 family peptidase [Kiritimatiellia bacterium]|nr:S41 family peptidase [Kiritimatiellia bacterium]HRZ13142.1 S41 family peptidase [Kiritimatiellia bacterium]HSA17563.1 S41 family peptidase [Kiritimatiellia bacterium]
MKSILAFVLGAGFAAGRAWAQEPAAPDPATSPAPAAVAAETAPAPAAPPEAPPSLKRDAVPAVEQLAALLESYGLTLDADSARRAAVSAMVKSADPGGLWLNEAEKSALEDRLQGFVFETGLRIRSADGMPKVAEVVAGSPAEAAGLQPGDRLEFIDGGAAASLKDWEIRSLLRGGPDSRFRVQFLRGAATQSVELAAARIPQPSVAVAEDLPTGIGYLRLNGLYDGASKEVIPALRGWDGTNYCGIIVDLRGAGGTNLAAAADAARLFAPEGALLFSLRMAKGQDIEAFRAPGGSGLDAPVMVLIDGETEGACEALAAVFADSLRGAMLIGSATRGDPAVREVVSCPGGGYLYLATRQLVMADGLVLNGRTAVEPDVTVEGVPGDEYEPEPDSRNGRLLAEEKEHRVLRARVRGDPALGRAADILLALKALNVRGKPPPEKEP